MLERPRRNRRSATIRALVSEARLTADDLVLPLFVQDGPGEAPIRSLPGHSRLGIESLLRKAEECAVWGIRTLALFPVIPEVLKDPEGS